MNHWFFGLGMYWWVFVAVGVAAALFFAARKSSPSRTAEETEFDILRSRYAAGEIDDAEYERRIQKLDAT